MLEAALIGGLPRGLQLCFCSKGRQFSPHHAPPEHLQVFAGKEPPEVAVPGLVSLLASGRDSWPAHHDAAATANGQG